MATPFLFEDSREVLSKRLNVDDTWKAVDGLTDFFRQGGKTSYSRMQTMANKFYGPGVGPAWEKSGLIAGAALTYAQLRVMRGDAALRAHMLITGPNITTEPDVMFARTGEDAESVGLQIAELTLVGQSQLAELAEKLANIYGQTRGEGEQYRRVESHYNSVIIGAGYLASLYLLASLSAPILPPQAE